MRKNELKRELFNYISGGLVPPIFSVKRNIKEQTKKVTIYFLNLSEIYRKKESFTNEEISSFIKENEESLKEKSAKEPADASQGKLTDPRGVPSDHSAKSNIDPVDGEPKRPPQKKRTKKVE